MSAKVFGDETFGLVIKKLTEIETSRTSKDSLRNSQLTKLKVRENRFERLITAVFLVFDEI